MDRPRWSSYDPVGNEAREALMAYPGLVIENPRQRNRMEFVATRDSSGGERVEGIATIEPGGAISTEHIHPLQEESFEVLSGALSFRVGGEAVLVGRGDSLVVPPGTSHGFQNETDGPCEVRGIVRPPLRMEEFIEMGYGLARDGLVDERGKPGLLRMAPVLHGPFRDHFYLAGPPIWAQKLLFAVLAPIARLRGYKSEYPEYVATARKA